ncbi:MAG TPA: 4-hydroxybenzoyl-CoA reductase subunit beta [Xanthobacteraceae bacterium]|nr:4-hydroxybenzoyl-CoA reductase subunit beta [Xanthobacteraceae bacterium]
MTAPLPHFRLARLRDVEAAIAACRENAGSRYLAGGTDLVVNMRRGLSATALLIDLSAIEELSGVSANAAGVRIGAGVTLAALAAEPCLQRYRAIVEAARAVAAPGHRGMGTLGGNLCLDTRCIYYNQSDWWRRANGFCLKHAGDVCHVAPQGQRCHAAFSGDLAPALMVLGAEVEIAGPDGRRRIALERLYVEDGKAHLAFAPGELVVAAHLPPAAPRSTYDKVRVRGAIDFPLAGVAVALKAANGAVETLRVALTGTNSRPFLLDGTDGFLGRPIDAGALAHLDKLVQKQVQPMRTTAISAHYRRLAAAALARRLAERLFVEREIAP